MIATEKGQGRGVSVGHAAETLAALHKDMVRCLGGFAGTYWDDEIRNLTAKMRTRARLERKWRVY